MGESELACGLGSEHGRSKSELGTQSRGTLVFHGQVQRTAHREDKCRDPAEGKLGHLVGNSRGGEK